ncbi:hypothetical protein K7X08_022608 [Anisodus acutangulus]|uniref:Uncharacterized protein n=1 Tax=Anisodus acutangulus TaxID=402998 RepID=A0A9Q1MLG8_9SOLA|nr:hypothetical protein K7X08_022608 [Anisodus acutangulus]
MDNKQDGGDAHDDTMKDANVNVGVYGGESMKEVVGEQNNSQGEFPFVSMSDSTIVAITKNYHTNKKVENEKVPHLKALNSGNLLDDDFLVNLSDPATTTIIQAAKVGAASTKGEEHEEDALPRGGDVITEGGNLSIDVVSGTRNVVTKFVVPPLPKDDIVRPQAGQVRREEVLAKVTLQPADDIVWAKAGQVAEEVHANATGGVKHSEVGPSKKRVGVSNSKDEPPEFVIPPGMVVVEIGDDETTTLAPRKARPKRLGRTKQSSFVVGFGLVWS